jgi:serine/threonine protein kinase
VPRSEGIILITYIGQMLFGRRPFGEGKSQERVLSEGLILNASEVCFPSDSKDSKIKISDEAKDFIRQCLTRDQRYRCVYHIRKFRVLFSCGLPC